MARVGQKNTAPEMVVRKLLHASGFRFRIHKKSLPGTPDIYLRKHNTVIQVHGCFWHGHTCRKGKLPSTRTEFWENKIKRNKLRDAKVKRQLIDLGLKVLVLWECETRDIHTLQKKLLAFFD